MSTLSVPKTALLNAMEVLCTRGRCRILCSIWYQLLSSCVILIIQTEYKYYIIVYCSHYCQ